MTQPFPRKQERRPQGTHLLFLALLLFACNLSTGVDDSPRTAMATEPPAATAPSTAAIVPSPGQAFYVAPAGSDANDGGPDTPWQTIQHAVNQVAPGDTILLRSGTYAGARIEQSGTADAWLTLAAAPDAQVVINAPGPANKHGSNLEFETWAGPETVAYWVIAGLEITNAPFWGIDVRGNPTSHSHHFIIQANRVHDNGRDQGKSGIFFAFVDDVVVEDNDSFANGEHGIYLSNSGDRFSVSGNRLYANQNCGLHINGDLEQGEDGIISSGIIENNTIFENGAGGCAAINLDGVTDTLIRNNLLYENHAGGIAIFQENGAICSQNIQILNNTIVQAEDGRWAIVIAADDCINNTIFNNIILTAHPWRGSIVLPTAAIAGFESDYNIIMDRFSADDDDSVISLAQWQALGYDRHSITALPDALFPTPGEYGLSANSPAVDAGLPLPGVTFDMSGTVRPQGAGFDIGALERPLEAGGATPTDTPPATAANGGTIVYSVDGRLFRSAAEEGAVPEDISLALTALTPAAGDRWINVSPDGEWLLLETERFDPACLDWACLAVVTADLSTGSAVQVDGQVIHPQGFSAIASGGDLIVFISDDGPNGIDLWALSRTGDVWNTPQLLTADSPFAFNYLPALAADSRSLLFNCGPQPYGGEGTAICEIDTDGTNFRVILTPADAPAGFPTVGALHQPDYAPDGSIVFEADWAGEQIWRLPANSIVPIRVTDAFGNDNSPCVLPDGRIATLWLNRPGGNGYHELKVMGSNGDDFIMILVDFDVQDVGMGCGG